MTNNPKPAEPVIEVALGEPTCEYCGPVCYGGAAHNVRVEDGARYTDDPVPAQEAPREPKCECGHEKEDHADGMRACGGGWVIDDKEVNCGCDDYEPPTAEPQAGAQPEATEPCEFHSENAWGVCRVCAQRKAGAQVPSQDEIPDAKTLFALLSEKYGFNAGSAIYQLSADLVTAQTALQHITAYATEAAKTPITRESILAAPRVDEAPIAPDDLREELAELDLLLTRLREDDPAAKEIRYQIGLIERVTLLTAEAGARKLHELAQYDEMQGLCRLILSESGGGK